MTDIVFVAVLGAAFLHASWNALVKGGGDKTVNMGAVVLGHVPLALVAAIVAPVPQMDAFLYLLGSAVLHFGYQVFLLEAYKFGDLIKVYPLARGSAPLIVTVISYAVLGIALTGSEILAVLVIATGILFQAFGRGNAGTDHGKTVLLALITGLFIAGYSLVDGIGAQRAGTSLGFYAWASTGNAILMAIYIFLREPAALRGIATHGKSVFLLGGSASFIAYAIATWAFTKAPIAVVTALRETSIAFAVLIGVFVLKERVTPIKLLSIGLILLGAALLRFVST
ncbi:MAG: DMT family transporter [Paracoccaceae bacterium]|nr:DMT family transporter [Paracoccaceae bacterium]